MKAGIRKLREALKHIGARSIAMALAVFLLTAGIAVFTGISLNSTEKELLLQHGELIALESAREYDRCLLTRANIVSLAGRVVDLMIASGEDNRAVEKRMTEVSTSILEGLDPTTTGIYGWVRKEYLDGSGWVPDPDYVATERPWYIETLSSNREITFVEPYVDAQTGTVMMTVTDLLADGESVIAMDVSLDPIQQIVESVTESTEGCQACVLDTFGIVVAHSDKEQLGKKYLNEGETLNGRMARMILTEGRMQFELSTAEGNYSVYTSQLEGGWYCVSMINADVWYRSVRRAMAIFLAVLALVLSFLLVIFLRMSSKDLALKRLHSRIDQEERRGEELQALSETDRMTGLLDRVCGERRINELLSAGNNGLFLELDIDSFKSINDSFGHQTGDEVIRAVADILRDTCRSNDILMRLGGDEFCVFAMGIVNQELSIALTQRLFDRLEACDIPKLEGRKFYVSVGAVVHREGSSASFADLYAQADSAMYLSKKQPGNSLTFAPGKTGEAASPQDPEAGS